MTQVDGLDAFPQEFPLPRLLSSGDGGAFSQLQIKEPTLNVDSFLLVPETLQNRLIMVMETATTMAQSEDSDSFSNPVRTKLFTKIMNGTMGF